MAAIDITGVSKSFAGRQVLAELDLTIANGELICLLGPSGCGKTTLLRILAGFIAADAGSIRVAGQDVTKLAASARRMGMVFQSYSLFPNMTVLDNVRFGPRVAGRPKAEQLSRAGELLELVGLSSHAGKYPHQLSGGQQQRVALARALAMQPQVLLLDEPLSALDAKVRLQLREEIRRIQRETGVTTVLVTHDQEEALSIADRVAVMHDGRLLQIASPATIYRQPADGFVARFIGAGAVLDGIAEPAGVRVGQVLFPTTAAATHSAGSRVELFLRPEHVRVAAQAGDGSTPSVAAEVREVTFLGAQTRLRMSVAGDNALWADMASEQAEAFKPGDAVFASWDIGAPRLMPI